MAEVSKLLRKTYLATALQFSYVKRSVRVRWLCIDYSSQRHQPVSHYYFLREDDIFQLPLCIIRLFPVKYLTGNRLIIEVLT